MPVYLGLSKRISMQDESCKSSNVSIGLCNPKSPMNVGSVMRAAGCYKADSVLYTGDRYERAVKFNTDTRDAARSISLSQVEDLLEGGSANRKVVCVELAEGAIPLPEFQHPDDVLYIFGPEDGTIDQKLVDRADAVVYVPTVGCMNLAATVNVVLYDRLVKSDSYTANDALIRESRDTNNRLKVVDN